MSKRKNPKKAEEVLSKLYEEALDRAEKFNLCQACEQEGETGEPGHKRLIAVISFSESRSGSSVFIPGDTSSLWKSGDFLRQTDYLREELFKLERIAQERCKEQQIKELSEEIDDIAESLTRELKSLVAGGRVLRLSLLSKELGRLEAEQEKNQNKEDDHE